MRRWPVWILLAVLFPLLYFSCCVPRYKYPIGKDTADVYGDGEFQIGIHEEQELLSNEKYHITVLRSIVCKERIGETVYFIGTDEYSPNYGTHIYGVLSIEENLFELYWEGSVDAAYLADLNRLPTESNIRVHSSCDEFQEEDWRVLESMKNHVTDGK